MPSNTYDRRRQNGRPEKGLTSLLRQHSPSLRYVATDAGWRSTSIGRPLRFRALVHLAPPGSERTRLTHSLPVPPASRNEAGTGARFSAAGNRIWRTGIHPSPVESLRIDTVLWLRRRASAREGAAAHVANPASVNGLLHALRGIAREAFQLGLMDGDDYQRIRLGPLIRYRRPEAGRSLRPGEISHLVKVLLEDGSPAAVRDNAMLAVLCVGGLRRAELAGLTVANLHEDENGPHLRVVGKGNRERKVFIEPGARAALDDWLALRGDRPGALFCRVSKAGRLGLPEDPDLPVPHVSTQAAYDVVRKRARAAGLDVAVSPHDFRRTLLTHLL